MENRTGIVGVAVFHDFFFMLPLRDAKVTNLKILDTSTQKSFNDVKS